MTLLHQLSLLFLTILFSSTTTSSFTTLTMTTSSAIDKSKSLTQRDYKARLLSNRSTITSTDVATLPKPGTTAVSTNNYLSIFANSYWFVSSILSYVHLSLRLQLVASPTSLTHIYKKCHNMFISLRLHFRIAYLRHTTYNYTMLYKSHPI